MQFDWPTLILSAVASSIIIYSWYRWLFPKVKKPLKVKRKVEIKGFSFNNINITLWTQKGEVKQYEDKSFTSLDDAFKWLKIKEKECNDGS